MIKVVCDSCKAEYNLKDELAGKKAKCPNCSNIIEIPNGVVTEESKEKVFSVEESKIEGATESVGISQNQFNNNSSPEQEPVSQGKSLFGEETTNTGIGDKKTGIYSHHIYGVKQKKLAINEKYFIRDKDNKDIMFSIRKVHLMKGILAMGALLGGIALTFFVISAVASTGIVVLGIVGIIGFIASIAASIAIYPKRHIEFFEAEDSDELAEFIILQDKKVELINKSFTLKDKHGATLAIFRKNLFTDILRKTWHIEFEGKHIIVKEDSVILSILRRFMPYGQLIRTNFIFLNVTNDPKSNEVIGYFKRKFELFDNYVLDLTNDMTFSVPRQIALCMAVLLDTGERR